jgi:hypothetical protein
LDELIAGCRTLRAMRQRYLKTDQHSSNQADPASAAAQPEHDNPGQTEALIQSAANDSPRSKQMLRPDYTCISSNR